MEKQVDVLAWLYLAYPLLAIVVGIVLVTTGVAPEVSAGDLLSPLFTLSFISVIAWLSMLIAGANLVAGVALHTRASWSRTFGLVLGFLNLPNVPFGTLLGGYAIWVLSKEGSREVLAG